LKVRKMRTIILALALGGIAVAVSGCDARDRTAQFGEAHALASGASNPTVAVAPGGGALYVAWVGATADDGNVYVSRSDDGISFRNAVRANDIDGDAAPHEQAPAQVDVGPDGHVYVVWQKNTHAEGRRFPYSDLRLARSIDGGRTFEPAITVNDDAGGAPSSHTFHDVLVAADGTVYVTWIDGRSNETASSDGSPAHNQHGAQGGPEIRVARSIDGGRTFSPSIVVATNACPCCRTSLAASPAGEVYVAWRTILPGNIRDIVVARSDDRGATWSTATRAHDDGWVFDACPHAGPSVAVNDDGRVHVAWYTGVSGAPGIYMAASSDRGATFNEPRAISSAEWVPPSQVKLAVDGRGHILAAWDDRRHETPVLNLEVFDGEDGRRLGRSEPGWGVSPAIASAGGTSIAAWLDGDTVRVRTMMTRSEPR
jgi:hypothetical protein